MISQRLAEIMGGAMTAKPVVDAVLPGANAPRPRELMDILRTVFATGRERSGAFAAMLAWAGQRPDAMRDSASTLSVLAALTV